MQRRAIIWILGAFKTSPVEGIKVIAGLIPIKLHLQKLVGRLQLCPLALFVKIEEGRLSFFLHFLSHFIFLAIYFLFF